MNHHEATTLLHDVEEVRRRVRLDLEGLSFPLLLFGVLLLGGAVTVVVVSGLALAVYWAVAGPAGGAATAVYFYRRARSEGVEPDGLLPMAIGLGIIGGSFLVYALALRVDATFAAATPFMVVAAGSTMFALVERELRFAGVAVGLGLTATALGLSALTPMAVSATLSVAYGVIFILYGLTFRRSTRDRR